MEEPVVYLFRVWLFGRLRVERREPDGTWKAIEEGLEPRLYGPHLLRRLLCTEKRSATKGRLLEDLWPNGESAERYLNNAAGAIRRVMGKETLKTIGSHPYSSYALDAERRIIWTDYDACNSLLDQVKYRGTSAPEAFTWLKEAEQLFARGTFLEDDGGQWSFQFRTTMETRRYRCLLWLAEAYEQRGDFWNAEKVYHQLLEEDGTNEKVIRCLLAFYHRQGEPHLAKQCYQKSKALFEREGLSLAPETEAYARKGDSEASSRLIVVRAPFPEMQLLSPSSAPYILSDTQDIIGEEPKEEPQTAMNTQRRKLLETSFKLAGSALVADTFLHTELLERVSRALSQPSSIDATMLHYLDKRLEMYWSDVNEASLAVHDLLPFVLSDLNNLTALLERPLLPTTRTHLCSLVGETALLIGKVQFNLGANTQARRFFALAIQAAREANNPSLEAVAWARNSFTWTYEKSARGAEHALSCMQAIEPLSASVHESLRCWLASVEAEVQANMHNREACLNALEKAARYDASEDQRAFYWTDFDASLEAGYRGVCFLRLSSQEADSKDFLAKAEEALKISLEVLTSLPNFSQRRIYAIRRMNGTADLASVHIQRGEIEQACNLAQQTIHIALNMEGKGGVSPKKRFISLRRQLEPWSNTQEVRALDQRLETLSIS